MASIKTNFSYNFMYQLLTFVTPIITIPYLARTLGPENIGIYSYAYSMAFYFVLFAMLGVNNYGNREIAKVRDDIKRRSQIFWEIYFLQGIFSVLVICGYLLYSYYMRDNAAYLMAIYVFSAAFDINWFFWGLEEFKLTVIRNTAIKLMTVIMILLFIKSPEDTYKYITLMAVSMLLSTLVLWPYLKNRVFWYKPKFSGIFSHLKPNLILFVPVVAVSIYKVLDKIMLGNLASFEEVGFFDYSEKVIAIPISCVIALGTVMLPRMSYLVAKEKSDEEKRIIHKSVIIGVGLSTAMSLGLIGIADIFVPFFYGSGYSKCIELFYILLPSCIFLAMANIIRTQYLIPHSMDKEYTYSLLIGAIVNVAANYILIPLYQSIGAAMGTFLAEMIVCLMQVYFVRKVLPILEYGKEVMCFLIIGVIMVICIQGIPFINTPIITICVKILVGGVIFCILSLIKYKKILVSMISK